MSSCAHLKALGLKAERKLERSCTLLTFITCIWPSVVRSQTKSLSIWNLVNHSNRKTRCQTCKLYCYVLVFSPSPGRRRVMGYSAELERHWRYLYCEWKYSNGQRISMVCGAFSKGQIFVWRYTVKWKHCTYCCTLYCIEKVSVNKQN